ncbi:reticulocyte binding protein 2 precursor [Plasmodium gonderi]|uniref:Reticulocyte binding protein 2 n=1 Tax=Plasmodium gonderi TaxID=77519 RepID=A0A1Y1JMS9_PLAGO|nr:reticulocyte binding protein 2 precursor [Plasmodium gonderi]GAW83896.1 reticulocyte binding protein 2 precursor [Plasmodium gonderi]
MLWKILYNILFALLGKIKLKKIYKSIRNCIYASAYNNSLSTCTCTHELKLSTLHENLIRSNQFQQDNGEKACSKNDDNNKINAEDDKKLYSYDSTSFGPLENDITAKKSSYYSYIKGDNTYTRNTNKRLNMNEKFNSVSNAFIQNNRTRNAQTQSTARNSLEYVNKSAYSRKLPSPRSRTISYTTDNIDYIDVIDGSDYYLISQLRPHYAYIHFFDEFKRISSHNGEHKRRYDNLHKTKIDPIIKSISNAINGCKREKDELKRLINILESPQKLRELKETYAEKFREYEIRNQKFRQCLLDKNRNNSLEIAKIKNEVSVMLNNVVRNNWHRKEGYTEIIKIYLLGLKAISYNDHSNFINRYKHSYNNGINIIKKSENKIDDNFIISSIKFTQEEIKYIVNRFDYHLSKVKQTKDYITGHSEVSKLKLDAYHYLEQYYFSVASNYAIFKLSTDSLKMLSTSLIHKERIINNLFDEFVSELEKKVAKHIDSQYFIKNSDNIILKSNEILKYRKAVYHKTEETIEKMKVYNNLEIKKVKNDCDTKMAHFKTYLTYIESHILAIKTSRDYNLSEKNSVLNKKKAIPSNLSSLEKAEKLFEIIDKIRYSEISVSDSFENIKNNYKEIEKINTEMHALIGSINDQMKNLENLTKKEDAIRDLKEHIKEKMEYIKQIKEKIKEIISLNNDADRKFLEVDKLVNAALFQKDEFEKKKVQLEHATKEIITKFYKGDLQLIVEDMTNFLSDEENFNDKTSTKEEVEDVLTKTNEKRKILEDMKCDNISQILHGLKEELAKVISFKDEIANKQFENMLSEMSRMSAELTKEYDNFKIRFSDYEREKRKLQNYKDHIIIRMKKMAKKELVNDEDSLEEQNKYSNFVQIKEIIFKKETEITSDTSKLHDKIRIVKSKLQKYKDLTQMFEIHTKRKDLDMKSGFEKIESDINELKLSEFEVKFNVSKDNVINTIKEIENINKNIDAIKTLNASEKNSIINKKSMEKLIENKNNLKGKIDNHTEKINKDKLIEQSKKTIFLNSLDREKTIIEERLNDTNIKELNVKIDKMLKYCHESREKIKDNNGNHSEELDEQEIDWENLKGKIDALSGSYLALDRNIDDIINNQYEEIIILIDKLIVVKGNGIDIKTQGLIRNIEKMKTRLSSIDSNEDIKKYESSIKEGLGKLKAKSHEILKKIEDNHGKLTSIKTKASECVAKSNEVKNKQIESNKIKNKQNELREEMDKHKIYSKNKDELDEINKKLTEESENLDTIERLDTASKEIDNVEMEYDKLLVNHIVHMIDNEKTKATNLMNETKSYVEKIESARNQLFGETQKNTTEIECKVYEQACIDNIRKIGETLKKAEEKKGESEKADKMENVKNIKGEVNKYLKEAIDDYNSMQKALEDIKDVHNLLMSTSAKNIANEISKNANAVNEFREKGKSELEKMRSIIDAIEKKLEEAGGIKRQIHINSDDNKIDNQLKQINEIYKEITNREDEIDEILRNIKEYRDNALSEVRKAERGKIKIAYLEKNKESQEKNNVDMKEVDKNIVNCKLYEEEVLSHMEDAQGEYELYLKHKSEISGTLNESEILVVETKSEKRKNDAKNIMDDIEKEYNEIKIELQESLEKLKELASKHTVSVVENSFQNKTSTDANVFIEYNLIKVKQNLSSISNIKQEVNALYTRAKDSYDIISKNSPLEGNNKLQNVEREASEYLKYIEKIKGKNQLIKEKRRNLKEIISDNKNIEEELKKHSKLFELGLLDKIKDIAENRKVYMDSTDKLLSSSINQITTNFNGFDVKVYKIGSKLNDYKRKISEFLTEFANHYELIKSKVKNSLDSSVDFDGAKKLREEVQELEKNLERIEEKTKKYLSNIKKIECFRLIHKMKEYMNEINKKCKQEYEKVNEDHLVIQQIIGDFKNLNDEKNSSAKLKQAGAKIEEVKKRTSHYLHKNEAHNVIEYMVKASKMIGITVTTGIHPAELNAKAQLKNNEELQFEPRTAVIVENENFSENKDVLDVHKNMKDVYKIALDIYKYSYDIIKKQEECDKLVKMGGDKYHNIKLMNELKGILENVDGMKNIITTKIKEAFNKLSELNKITCNDENCENILEKANSEELKNLIDSFNEEKKTSVVESKLKECKNKFESQLELLNVLGKSVDILSSNEMHHRNIEEKESSVHLISSNLKDIEKEITDINSSFDELLNKGKKCEKFKYSSIKDNLNTKINNCSIFIDEKKQNVAEYLTYIQSNYSSIFQDIDTLNYKLDGKRISKYGVKGTEEANKISTQLTAAVNEYDGIINIIRNEFIDINEQIDVATLENSVKKLKDNYDSLCKKKDSIKEFHDKINLIKLKEINACSDKYIDIAKEFTDAVDHQRKRLLELQNRQNALKHNITENENELISLDSSFTLVSIKTFDLMYDNIKYKINELNKLEESNINELEKVKTYEESVSYLLTKKDTLLDDINNYEKRDKLKNENNEITNEVNRNITTTKEKIRNLEEYLYKLLKNIRDSEKLYTTNNTKSFTSAILEKADNMRENFTKNFPENEKKFQIENNYKEIKGIVDEINKNPEINVFIENMTKYIQDGFTSVKGSEDAQKIKKVKDDIIDNYTKVKSKLSEFNNALDMIKLKKNEMNTLFSSLLKENRDNNKYVEFYILEVDKITKQMEESISKMLSLINFTENNIKLIEEKLYKILSLPVNDRSDSTKNDLLNDSKEQEINRATTKTQKLAEKERYSDTGDIYGINTMNSQNGANQNGNEEYQNRGRYNPGGENTRILFAGGVILGLSVCYGISLITNKRNNEEMKESDSFDEGFEGSDTYNMDDKEEAIDVYFDDGYDSE